MKLKCPCCGIEEEFSTTEEAYQKGWDAPPHFSHVACDLCPGVCVVLGQSHEKAHALWAKEGRPKEFTVTKCGTDDDFGNQAIEDELNKALEQIAMQKAKEMTRQ